MTLPKLPRIAGAGGAGGLVTLAGFSAFGAHMPAVAWVLCSILALLGAIPTLLGAVWPQNSADRREVLLALLGLFGRDPNHAEQEPGNAVDPPDPPGPPGGRPAPVTSISRARRRRRHRRTAPRTGTSQFRSDAVSDV